MQENTIQTNGLLKKRAEKLFDRLHEEQFSIENIFREESYSWSGDTEGRSILALVSLSKILHKDSKTIDEFFAKLKQKTNEFFYFGKPIKDLMNEQQISGNSWYLRALCEYYKLTNDKFVLEILESITENYLLKTLDFYKKYPLDPNLRKDMGGAIGALYEKPVNGWQLSTDTVCAFIPLDGITAVYEVLKDDRLVQLIELMIDLFQSFDKVELQCQTHATLSATRGIMRYFQVTGQTKWLFIAEELFSLYTNFGMTLNFANFNWFAKLSWTEPCAIIDSFMLAFDLFKSTKKEFYLEFANRIYFNAISFAQRDNGGFGCDSCVDFDNPFLHVHKDYFEAYWCCTMRGGEGLLSLAQNQYYAEYNKVFVLFANSNRATFFDDKLAIKQNAEDFINGRLSFEVEKNQLKYCELFVYLPNSIKNVKVKCGKCNVLMQGHFAKVFGKIEGKIEIEFDFVVNKVEIKEKIQYFAGDFLLGTIDEETQKKLPPQKIFEADGLKLLKVLDLLNIRREVAFDLKQKLVF